MIDANFFICSMPSSRPADYYLGYFDGAVFLDFNNCGADEICLIRISFDGYGCCELKEHSIPLDKERSIIFKNIIQQNIPKQSQLMAIVKQAIEINRKLIWEDALKDYNLI